jgi:hypothetical protein
MVVVKSSFPGDWRYVDSRLPFEYGEGQGGQAFRQWENGFQSRSGKWGRRDLWGLERVGRTVRTWMGTSLVL